MKAVRWAGDAVLLREGQWRPVGPLLCPELVFACHWWLERREEPSFAILRPYKLLPLMSRMRPSLAAP